MFELSKLCRTTDLFEESWNEVRVTVKDEQGYVVQLGNPTFSHEVDSRASTGVCEGCGCSIRMWTMHQPNLDPIYNRSSFNPNRGLIAPSTYPGFAHSYNFGATVVDRCGATATSANPKP